MTARAGGRSAAWPRARSVATAGALGVLGVGSVAARLVGVRAVRARAIPQVNRTTGEAATGAAIASAGPSTGPAVGPRRSPLATACLPSRAIVTLPFSSVR
ncbi:MAG: hypothetical protein ACYDCI_13440 [Candidatus Limnocylindrales bacterium]